MSIFTTHIRAVRDLRNNYKDVSKIIENRDHVIITNNGMSEAVVIPFSELESYEEYIHIRYVKEKLAEAEVTAQNPNEWIGLDDLFKQWDEWETVKL